jgi:proteasome lid subunit RPN8/RPN11
VLLSSPRTALTPAEALDVIYDWAMELAPAEACGIIVNLPKDGYRLYHLANEATDPTGGYRISAESLAEVVESEEVWEDSVTIWHTHPGGLVGPSEGDLRNMMEGCRYMVVTLPSLEVAYFGASPIFRR